MLTFNLLAFVGFLALSSCLPHSSSKQLIVEAEPNITSIIRDILLDNDIIDDVLDDFEPDFAIDLAYPKFHEAVMLGNDIPVKAVSERPTIFFHPVTPAKHPKSNSTFTLIMTDPDATSRDDPKMSEMCHWIITNLTMLTALGMDVGTAASVLKKRDGELESYYPPAPPKGTGKHRYVFVLLEGKPCLNLTTPKERPHWGYGKVRHGVRDWAEENKLKVVGANFFYAMHQK